MYNTATIQRGSATHQTRYVTHTRVYRIQEEKMGVLVYNTEYRKVT